MSCPTGVRPGSGARVIALAPNDWNGPWMNRQQLLSRLGRRHRVLYSTGAVHGWMRHRPSWRKTPWLSSVNFADNVHLDVPGKLPLRMARVKMLDRFALRSTVRRWLKALRDTSPPLVLHVFDPSFIDYLPWVRSDLLIYHAYDLYPKTPGWNPALDEAERKLAESAGLTIGSSQRIVDHLEASGAVAPMLLPNGVDYAAFSRPWPEPYDMADIPHPRIGYAGSLNRKVDFRMLRAIAQAQPSWQIVLVGDLGSLSPSDHATLEQLFSYRNVHHLGHKNRTDLPAYIAAFDIGLLIYAMSDSNWTEGVYPLKLHEYLAVGLPVVSSDLPSVRQFSNVVRLVDSEPEAWIEAINCLLRKGHSASAVAQRRRTAAENDWEFRARDLDAAIMTRLYGKGYASSGVAREDGTS